MQFASGLVQPGIGLVNKPTGVTSFSVVQAAHAQTPIKLCHGGTLDPFAEGLLLLLADPATAWEKYLHTLPKTYEATLAWGYETDTGDGGGQVVAQSEGGGLKEGNLEQILPTFLGWTQQQPPAHSAKRIQGERAYERVFRGETVEMPYYKVYLHQATWLAHQLPHQSRIRIVCRGGFYVRSLVRDIGRALGCFATTIALKRTQIGPFTCPDLVDWRTGAAALPWAPQAVLTDPEIHLLKTHQPIPERPCLPPQYTPEPDYPIVSPPILGLHRGRCSFLLEKREKMWWPTQSVRGLRDKD